MEKIYLTPDEKRMLLLCSPSDELKAAINKNELLPFQRAYLSEFRKVKKYLVKKYPGVKFVFVDVILYPERCYNIHFRFRDRNPMHEYFTAGANDWECTDNYWCNFANEAYYQYLQNLMTTYNVQTKDIIVSSTMHKGISENGLKDAEYYHKSKDYYRMIKVTLKDNSSFDEEIEKIRTLCAETEFCGSFAVSSMQPNGMRHTILSFKK